ncbi:MAG: hypothetical protein AB7P16_28710 [Bradyrhizobium sp.]
MTVEPVGLLAARTFDPSRSQLFMEVSPGTSIAGMIERAYPDICDEEWFLSTLRVTVGHHVVERRLWSIAKPKPGTHVVIRPIPRGKNLLRNLLLVVVAVAAIAVGQIYVVPLLTPALGAIGAQIAGGLIASGITLAGTALVNALVPAKTGSSKKDKEKFSLSGWRNPFNPTGGIPLFFGKKRYAPPYGARAYITQQGDDSYCTAAFLLGYPGTIVTEERFGETAIGDYTGVEQETLLWSPGDPPPSLYPQYVWQEGFNAGILWDSTAPAATPLIRKSARQADRITLTFSFPQGLVKFGSKGKKSFTVELLVQQRLNGIGAWNTLQTLSVTEKKTESFIREIDWLPPVRGQYEFRITRLAKESDSSDVIDKVDLAAITTRRNRAPWAFEFPVLMKVMRVKASKQLQGTIDNYNFIGSRVIQHWNGATWVSAESPNPGSCLRSLLQGPSLRYPKTDDEIWLDHPTRGIQQFAEYCTAKGLEFNHVYDEPVSIADIAADICRAGRAVPHDDCYRRGVIVDKPRAYVSDTITPNTTWGFGLHRDYPRLPDALRVKFENREHNYEFDELIVPRPGFVGDPQKFDEIEQTGLVGRTQVWRYALYYWYQLLKRSDTWTAQMGLSSLGLTRGDRVGITQPMLDVPQRAGRVIDVLEGGRVVLGNAVEMEAGQSYAIRFRKANSDVTEGAPLYVFATFPVTTVPGTHSMVNLIGDGDLPEAGQHYDFGLASRLEFEAIVRGIESGSRLSARLVMTNHAPEIEALVDASNPPPEGTDDIEPPSLTPAAPTIYSISTEPGPADVTINVRPGNSVPLSSYDLHHRLVGAGSWTTVSFPAANSSVIVSSYALGDEIEVEARAVGLTGAPGPFSAIETFVVGSDLALLQVLTFTATELSPGLWNFVWALNDLPPGAGVKIRYKAGIETDWAALTPLHTGTITVSPWASTVPTTGSPTMYTFGAIAIDETGAENGTPVLIFVATSLFVPSLDFSNPLNSQYIALLEDI